MGTNTSHCSCMSHGHTHHHAEGSVCGCGHEQEQVCSCGCHHHEDEQEDSRGMRMRILAAALLLVVALLIDHVVKLSAPWALLMYLVPYVVAGSDVLLEAGEGIRSGNPFDEHLLMAIATIGALVIGFIPGGQPEFAEAVFVMLFFQVGELFEDIASDHSRKSIAELMDIRPDIAHVERGDDVLSIDPNDVAVGEIIVVRPGERIPMDGILIEGDSTLDTVALTGESMPRRVGVGDTVVSGCVNQTGVLRIQVSHIFGESTASKILELVESSNDHKSHSEHFITRFARIYTPVVVFAACAVALVPPLVSGHFTATFATWLLRALTFLVVSCPCALVISIPLTFFGGIGGASRQGILIKGSDYLEALSTTDTVVFDKTGTLTRGVFRVNAVHSNGCTQHQDCEEEHRTCEECADARKQLLHLAAHVEHYSQHPIADVLRAAYPVKTTDNCTVEDVSEVAGRGVVAFVDGRRGAVGSPRLMEDEGAVWVACTHPGTVIHISIDRVYAGHIVISDEVKDDAADAIAALHSLGVKRTVMLTGDRTEVAVAVAHDLGVDECHAELLPADKVSEVERLLGTRAEGHSVAFVGDGINDAPALARADVGIVMGALGSDAAIDAADVVLMDDAPSKVATAIRLSRRTLGIARQNIVFSIAVKIAILLFAAVGMAPMWLAVFGDVGVMVLAVLNATRALA